MKIGLKRPSIKLMKINIIIILMAPTSVYLIIDTESLQAYFRPSLINSKTIKPFRYFYFSI